MYNQTFLFFKFIFKKVTILLADWERVASNLIREPSKKRTSPLKRIQHELNKENMVGIKGRPIIVGGKQQQQLAGAQKPKKVRINLKMSGPSLYFPNKNLNIIYSSFSLLITPSII
jgi:hypothetical protein